MGPVTAKLFKFRPMSFFVPVFVQSYPALVSLHLGRRALVWSLFARFVMYSGSGCLYSFTFVLEVDGDHWLWYFLNSFTYASLDAQDRYRSQGPKDNIPFKRSI